MPAEVTVSPPVVIAPVIARLLVPVIVPVTVKAELAVNLVALSVPTDTDPVDVNVVRPFSEVIFGWAAVVSVPDIFVPLRLVTVRFVRVPKLVIPDCVPAVNVPLKLPPAMVPVTVKLPA